MKSCPGSECDHETGNPLAGLSGTQRARRNWEPAGGTERSAASAKRMGVSPGNRRVLVSVPERYVAEADSRGRQEGRPYQWSQQVIHEISGLGEEAKLWLGWMEK
jgi:hypothetical protein